MTEFLVPARPAESELVVKRSRFLGHLVPVSSEDEAKAFLQEMRKRFYDARHNCWCYRIYDGPERYSDDGEPQGSAGMPMLEVFRREEIWNFCCVVTRYFGGVLLGTGGLARAYGSAAKEALALAGTRIIGEWTEIRLVCGYGMLEKILAALRAAGAVITETEYGGEVTVRASVPASAAEAAAAAVTELSGGKVIPAVSGTVLRS